MALQRVSTEGEVRIAEIELTNAQVKALRASPAELVPAPGAGYVLELVSIWIFFDYTGAYTETADNLAVCYGTGAGTVAMGIEATGFVDASADTAIMGIPDGWSQGQYNNVGIAKTALDNQALVLANAGDGEYGGGNAANVWRVKTTYRIHTCGW